MNFSRKLVSLALLCSLALGMVAQPALAADEPVQPVTPTVHDVSCTGDGCTLHIDLGAWQVPLLWRYGAPMLVENMQKNGQLPAGAALTISDDLTIKLPVGDLELLDSNLQVTLDESRAVESFRGTARVPFPTFGLLETLQVADPLRADVGFDYGANLPAIDAPLDPERRYFFFDFGSGIRLDGAVTGADGSAQAVSITVPRGQRAVLVIDPLQPLVYLQGQITLNHTGNLAFLDNMLAANGVDVPGLELAGLPGRTSLGLTALITDDPTLSYLEVSSGSAIDAGPMARWMGVDATPLAFNGVARLDHKGLLVTGSTQSSVLPKSVWDGRGQVQVFVPFNGNVNDAFVEAGGSLAVPIARVDAEGSSRLALPEAEEPAVVEAGAPDQPGWWARTGAFAGGVVDGAANGLGAAGDAVAWTGDVIGAGAGAAWNATASAAGAVSSGTAHGATTAWQATVGGAACGLSVTQNFFCQASGVCSVAPACGDDGSEAVASR